MKKILLVTNYFLVKGMVESSPVNPEDCEILVVEDTDTALGILQEQRFSAVILTELVPGNWQDLINGTEEVEHLNMIVFRVGLDETSEPFVVKAKVFASVHGRTKQDDPNSLRSKLAELLGK